MVSAPVVPMALLESVLPSESRPTAQAQVPEISLLPGCTHKPQARELWGSTRRQTPDPKGAVLGPGHTGPASLVAGLLAGPLPADRQVSGQTPQPAGLPCSLGLWPEHLCDTLLPDGGTAGRARPSRGL